MRDNTDMIKLLLKRGSDPQIYNDHFETPLFYASKYVLEKFGLSKMKARISQKDIHGRPIICENDNKRIKLNLKPKRDE